MAKLTGNWYTDPMGEFYSWQDYEQLYREQEQSSIQRKNQIKSQKMTVEDCKKCPHLEILDVDDECIYRCKTAKEFRSSNLRNLIAYINCTKLSEW